MELINFMASPEPAITKVAEETLPYNTTEEDILSLVNAVKKKQGNNQAIKEVYGKTSNFETSKKTLETVGILDDALNFTCEGREFAYEENQEKRQFLLLRQLLKYAPYGNFLLHICHRDDLSETTLETLKNYWGKHNYGVSANNREDAAVVFGHFMTLTGLGKLTFGRRGKQSRIEWNLNIKSRIDEANEDNIDDKSAKYSESNVVVEIQNQPEDTVIFDRQSSITKSQTVDYCILPNNDISEKSHNCNDDNAHQVSKLTTLQEQNIKININIDMTTWDIDKINAFFKATRGEYQDEN